MVRPAVLKGAQDKKERGRALMKCAGLLDNMLKNMIIREEDHVNSWLYFLPAIP